MNVYTQGDITLDIISNVGNRVVEKISGKLGSGKIGLNANYILHNMGVDYEAYANIDEMNYNKILIVDNAEKTYPYKDDKRVISMKKKLRDRFVDE